MSLATIDEKVLKEMEKYEIRNFADIIRVLLDHPDWLNELRKMILTSELLELPRKMEEVLQRLDRLETKVDKIESDVEVLKQDVTVLKQDVNVLKQDVAVLKQDVAVLKQDVEILKQDVNTLKKDMNYMKGEFGRFKGKDFERTVKEKYPAYFGKVVRKSKLIGWEKLAELIDDSEEEGVISEKERNDLFDLDFVIYGELKESKKPVYLAVEATYSLYRDDIDRALSRADSLYKILKTEVIPTVVYVESSEDLEGYASDKGVLTLKVSY
ncbi:MAG: cell division protein ZapB [Hydrogenothermaceae bacterium]